MRLRFRLFCFIVLVFFAPRARAQESAGVAPFDEDPRVQQEIQRLYRESKIAGEKADWSTAYALMQQAWRKRQAADISVNLALIEMQLQKWRDAAEHLSYGLNHFPADADPELMRLNKERLNRCKQEVVTLTIHVDPDDAQVSLGGTRLGVGSTLPSEVFAEAGTVEVTAELGGYERAVAKLSASKGETKDVRLNLSRAQSVLPDGTAAHNASTAGPSNTPLYALGAVAVIGLGSGIGFHFAAQANNRDYERLATTTPSWACSSPIRAGDCQAADDATSGYKRNRTLSSTGFAIGGAAVVGLLAYYWFEIRPKNAAHEPTATRLRVGGAASPGGVACSLSRDF